MKIRSIGISNSLSFAPRDASSPNLVFQTGSNRGSRHILIGPNGAGKSNFIEIVNNCFRKALFERIQHSESPLMSRSRGEFVREQQLKQVVGLPGGQNDWNLRAHDGSGSDLQEITLALELNDNDFQNLEFLLGHSSQINQLLEKYTTVSNLVPSNTPADLRSCSTVVLTVRYQQSSNELTV